MMMSFTRPEEMRSVLLALLALLGGLFAWWNIRPKGSALSRGGARLVGLLWVSFATFEYWILGPHSALGRPDAYNVSIPWLHYITHDLAHGTFAPGYSGGVDGLMGVGLGAQYLSMERLLFGNLPLWMAIAAMNIGAIGFAYTGAYRVSRSMLHLSRGRAVVAGLIASGTHLVNLAWASGGIGWALALMPWGLYLFLHRNDRRWYLGSAAAFGLFYSASSSVIHGLPAFLLGLVFCSAFLRPTQGWRFVAGLGLFGLACLANWSDAFYALAQIGAESARANAQSLPPTLGQHLQSNADVLVLPLGLVALGWLGTRRDRTGLLLLGAFWLAFASGHLLGAMPWKATGIKLLGAYRWDLVSDSYLMIAVPLVGRVLAACNWSTQAPRRMRLPPVSAFYFAGLAVLAVAHHKAINAINYRGYGSVALFTDVPLLASPSWRPSEPFRVVSDYALFAPNVANAYGLETFDGTVQAFSLRQNRYYGFAVLRPRNPAPHTHVHFLQVPGDGQLDSVIDPAALRIANVRFVLGNRRLTAPGLTLVAHQDPLPTGPQGWLSSWAPRAWPETVYIHELADAWPRVFVPDSVQVSAHAADSEAFHAELLGTAATPRLLVGRGDAPHLGYPLPAANAVRLIGYRIVPDGLDLTLAPSSAGGRGVVIANLPYSTLWHATSGGRELPLVPVNGIHQAIVVEAIDREVQLRYTRRTLVDMILHRAR